MKRLSAQDDTSTQTTNAVLVAPSITTGITPSTNDGLALGSGTLSFADLFLASGGVINFANGVVTLTQASTTRLEIGGSTGAVLRVPSTGGLEIGSDTAITRSGAGTIEVAGVTIVTTTATRTLTNKRITPRIGTTASSATPTPDADANDQYNVTALAAGAVFAAPTGTPTDGQNLSIRIKDNGTARSLGWNAIYRAIGVTLPTTTVISKTLYIGMKYNSADTKWDVLAVGQEA